MANEDFYWSSLSDAYHLFGRFPEAATTVREGLKWMPNHGLVVSREMISLSALGQMEALRTRLDERSRKSAGQWWYGYFALMPGLDLIRHNRPTGARAFLDRAIRWFEKDLSPTELATFPWGLWAAYEATGRMTDAAALVDRIGIRSFAVRSVLDTLGVRALLAVHQGDTAKARRLRDQILTAADPRYRTQVLQTRLYWQAVLATALGEKDQAVQKLREWFERGGEFSIWEHFNPDFIPLHGYPPYEQLMRPKG